jgi:hypothetical protein
MKIKGNRQEEININKEMERVEGDKQRPGNNWIHEKSGGARGSVVG